MSEHVEHYDYDLVVIGGGSAGIAAAKGAAELGRRVLVCNSVTSSPRGHTWGMGGTSLHVGCVPKKLMHKAAHLSLDLCDAKWYGWIQADKVKHSWREMTSHIQHYVQNQSKEISENLDSLKVTVKHAKAEILTHNSIKLNDDANTLVTAKHIVIATGGRPKCPDIPGVKEFGITSDDFFSLPYCPGKTLIIGAGYVGMELAGILARMKLQVTVMTRNMILTGMDRQMADMVVNHMTGLGVTFLRNCELCSIEQLVPCTTEQPGLFKICITDKDKKMTSETYNTVLLAVGRYPNTSDCGLKHVGIKLHDVTKHIIVNAEDTTNIKNIFAIGDVAYGRAKLTPVAIKAAQLLVKRLYANSTTLTDYTNIPTTVYTPLEYGYVGVSEEEAVSKYGYDNLEVLSQHFQPIEFELQERDVNVCFCKLICVKSLNGEVVGLHILSPNAGEIIQGYAIALKTKATKSHFVALMGVHPTCAECFTKLNTVY